MKEPAPHVLTLRLDPRMVEQLRDAAARDDRSMNAQVTHVLRTHLADELARDERGEVRG